VRKNVWTTIGSFPAWTIEKARERAGQILRGEAKDETVEEVVAHYDKRHVTTLRSAHDTRRYLNIIAREFAGRAFNSIRRAELAELGDKIAEASGDRSAEYCLITFSAMSRWYAKRSDTYVSPMAPGMAHQFHGRATGADFNQRGVAQGLARHRGARRQFFRAGQQQTWQAWWDECKRGEKEFEKISNFLEALGSAKPSAKLRRSRGQPRNVATYLVIRDIADIFEWATKQKAARVVREDEEAGPFYDFAAAVWPVVFRKGDEGLPAALKNWALARKKFRELSPCIANMALRHPKWRLFER
jgi:hypothetical protein